MQRVLPGEQTDQGYHLVAMSCDGELVAAVSSGPSTSSRSSGQQSRVYVWQCRADASRRSAGPDAVLELPASLGAANAVTFCVDKPSCLMVTCDRNVAFMAWSGGALQLSIGQLLTKCPGKLVGSVYQRGTTDAVSVSAKGGALPT